MPSSRFAAPAGKEPPLEWIVDAIFWLLVLVCPLICFLIARATCRDYRNEQVGALDDAVQAHIDAQIAVNASQREVTDGLQEYIDAHDRLLQVRQEIILEALFVIRDMLELMEHPGDKRLAFFKFVERRNDLDVKLDALRENE